MLWKCILQAEDGTGLPEEILDQSNFQNAAKLYFIFIRFDFVLSLTYFALIVLNFLEVCTFFFSLILVAIVFISILCIGIRPFGKKKKNSG
jgi:hypothetical protein